MVDLVFIFWYYSGMSTLRTVWRGMRARCYSPNASSYRNYGGRGIIVCPRWQNEYRVFEEWSLANGWSPELQIDRIETDGPYCPFNCRYVDRLVNAANKRKLAANSTGFTGVLKVMRYGRDTGRWQAKITSKGKNISLGCYGSAILAAHARNEYIRDNGLPHPIQPLPPEYSI